MARSTPPSFRRARIEDLPHLVGLLQDDPLGVTRESGFEEAAADYQRAFQAVDGDPRNDLVVAEIDGVVCGCLQLTYIPGLTYRGGERAQIEGVRIAKECRGGGIGQLMVGHAIDLATKRGCVLVQLTSDKKRPEAIAFYRAAGFEASHEGLKLRL